MSLGLKGAFCPSTFPLFHGSQQATSATDLMMVSHFVRDEKECASCSPATEPRSDPRTGLHRRDTREAVVHADRVAGNGRHGRQPAGRAHQRPG